MLKLQPARYYKNEYPQNNDKKEGVAAAVQLAVDVAG